MKNSIYELPLVLSNEGLGDLVVEKLHIDAKKSDMSKWNDIVKKILYPKDNVKIAVVGKYVELQDAYKSVYESLAHAGIGNDCKVNIVRVDSENIERDGAEKYLSDVDGILIAGSVGNRGIEGSIEVAKYARENKIPYFGICIGMQVMAIDFARNVLNLKDANSTEFNPETSAPVVCSMEEQKGGKSMRIGAYDCEIKPNTKAFEAYKKHETSERHRHNFELNNAFKDKLENAGMVVGGVNKKFDLVEILEEKDHPWMVGVQFYPEFHSKPFAPHPLFLAFVKSAIDRKNK